MLIVVNCFGTGTLQISVSFLIVSLNSQSMTQCNINHDIPNILIYHGIEEIIHPKIRLVKSTNVLVYKCSTNTLVDMCSTNILVINLTNLFVKATKKYIDNQVIGQYID